MIWIVPRHLGVSTRDVSRAAKTEESGGTVRWDGSPQCDCTEQGDPVDAVRFGVHDVVRVNDWFRVAGDFG